MCIIQGPFAQSLGYNPTEDKSALYNKYSVYPFEQQSVRMIYSFVWPPHKRSRLRLLIRTEPHVSECKGKHLRADDAFEPASPSIRQVTTSALELTSGTY